MDVTTLLLRYNEPMSGTICSANCSRSLHCCRASCVLAVVSATMWSFSAEVANGEYANLMENIPNHSVYTPQDTCLTLQSTDLPLLAKHVQLISGGVHRLRWTFIEHTLNCVIFCLRDPQPVFGFHCRLDGHVLTTKRFIRWQPGGRIGVRLLLIRRAIHRQKVQRIIGKALALIFGEFLG